MHGAPAAVGLLSFFDNGEQSLSRSLRCDMIAKNVACLEDGARVVVLGGHHEVANRLDGLLAPCFVGEQA
ncbi:MAG: hypothetical protein C4298_04715 [Thermus sp.]